jgi:hypothetical protein
MASGSARSSPGSSGSTTTANGPVAAVGYHEDSLIFLTRGRLERIDDADAWLRENRTGILIVPFAASDDRPGLHKLGGVKGLNYSRGSITVLDVMERAR